ncbi:hypothetical protein PMKS-001115 [Pichia membranifaciens]|uniref:Uncharacterized protein n=1 Tax=Pichia membranifaciens TaxID=4926 RepID=A0A1Q2YDL6_9ASCO|nr:hypothetical protein PMKS-001115 [Pichia membranifaciens]
MGLFWGSSKGGSNADQSRTAAVEAAGGGSGGDNNDGMISEDLAQYLETRESQLSNREFKALLRRQSANAEASKQAAESSNGGTGEGGDFLSMIQAKGPQAGTEVSAGETGAHSQVEIPKLPTAISTANSMKKPKEYQNFEFEKYRRENDEKEVVLTNCSEIQHAFYDCLGRQKIWDRVTAVARLDSDECTKLADFFMACTEIQKKALLTFDYASLETVDEMKAASRKVDKVFTNAFHGVDEIRDKEKYMNYTKELRREREDFYAKFNK